MFLTLDHKRLSVYESAKQLVILCYKETEAYPGHEKFGLTQQIRRAAISVQLNIAEGCSRKSAAERKRYFEIARGSVIEIDAAFEIAVSLSFTTKEKLSVLSVPMIETFKLLSGMLKVKTEI